MLLVAIKTFQSNNKIRNDLVLLDEFLFYHENLNKTEVVVKIKTYLTNRLECRTKIGLNFI